MWLKRPFSFSTIAILGGAVALTSVGLLLMRRPATAEDFDPIRLDINQADADELATLPGLGPAMAARIVANRDEQGPFASIADLDRVPGIGAATIEQIEGFIVVDPSAGKR